MRLRAEKSLAMKQKPSEQEALLSHAASFPTTDKRGCAKNCSVSGAGRSPVLQYSTTYYTLPKVLRRQPGSQSAQTGYMLFNTRYQVYSTRRHLQ